MTKRKLSKASSSFLALALVLSVVIFAVPVVPARASPAQTLTLELGTATTVSEGSFRDLTLQAGDEVVQFTRDNVTIPSGGASGSFLTLFTSSYTVSGSLSGTILMEDNSISVDLPVASAQRLAPPEGQEPLAEVDGFGFSVGKFDFDDGAGNTFSGIIASDWDMDYLAVGHQGVVRSYMVSTEESGDFFGQKLIGTLAMKYQEPGFEILGATITLTHHFAGEITSLGTTEFEGSFIEGFSRPIPTLTGDTLVEFIGDNVALPGDGNTEFMGGGVSADITGGPLTGTMTSEMNLVDYYLAGFGWAAGKFSLVDGNDTISGVMLVDMEAETGEGYMFALSGGTTTGIYAGKEYFATLSATVDGVFTGSAEFMELSGAPVTFPDSNLEAAIREAIEVDGPIYASDLVGLSSLNAVERNITDLTGLEHCTSLTYLHLSRNQIDDISPISNLTSLTELDLDGNYISDISPLSDLTGLTELDLQGNQISDVSPLSNLTSLTWMHLGENEVSDISPLSSLTSLGVLWLRDNQITDINPLTNLTSLTELELNGNQISNVSPLENLTSLTYLNLEYNHISDITPLANLASVTNLHLGHNQISNINPLSNLTSLTVLELHVNQISDVSPLSGLTSLTYLTLNGNQISNISPLENLTSLTRVHLGHNQISDIKPLVNNTGLSEGDTIELMDLPLSPTSVSVYIPKLVARGVEVISDVVPEAPAADFSASPTSGTAPLMVGFTDQSTGGITDWEWDFDNDGRVDSTEQNPSYTYGSAGEYTVSLRVAGPGGEDIRVKSGIIRVKEKAEPKNGGGFDCGCSRVEAKTRSGELLIGWAVVGLCWGSGYYLVRRVNRRSRR